MTLGDLIKEYRTAHDVSQRQFAAMCGLSNGYISMLEKGEPKDKKACDPDAPAVKKTCRRNGHNHHGYAGESGGYAC